MDCKTVIFLIVILVLTCSMGIACIAVALTKLINAIRNYEKVKAECIRVHIIESRTN
ncbi:MAG: hypothetical protein Q4F95_08270 [Oscillospiraceae bacterium]|nr:hypothetical protein [Oscillospiraceae bacterium]